MPGAATSPDVLPRGASEGLGATWPMNYLHTFGPRADPATSLTWGLIWLSIAVMAVVTILVVAGIWLRGSRWPASGAAPVVEQGPSGLAWIHVGLALTVAALIVSLVWTVEVLAAIDSPHTKPALTLQVTGHQWWWEVRYSGLGADPGFATANEIHIPTGRPVLLELTSGDVIHSFWAPALSGKTDTIPGRTNLAWIEADRPGVYRGQCTEYCGVQHAHMAVYVVAESESAFEAWRSAQSQPAAPAPAGPGEALFVTHCGDCHTVRGSPAHGDDGPDLTHLMSRQTLAAGLLPNDQAALSGWISNPAALKPGTRMPASDLSGPQLLAVTAWLETLR